MRSDRDWWAPREVRLPTLRNRIRVSLPRQTKKGGTNGQEDNVTTRGAARREEEMVRPQDGRQIPRPQGSQIQGTRDESQAGQEGAAEAADRHQPSPRR